MYLLPVDIIQDFLYWIILNLMANRKRKHLKRDNIKKNKIRKKREGEIIKNPC